MRSCVQLSSKRLRSCLQIRRWLKGASDPRSAFARISSGRSLIVVISIVVSMLCSCCPPRSGDENDRPMPKGELFRPEGIRGEIERVVLTFR